MRNKAYIILFNDLVRTKTRNNKIVGLLTGIHSHRYNGKQQHTEKKGDQEFPEYIPVYFFH